MGPSLLGRPRKVRRKPARYLGPGKVWGPHFKEISGTEVGELEKQNGSYAMERHRKEERWILEASFPRVHVMARRSGLGSEVCLSPGDHGDVWTRLLSRALCEYLVLQQSGFVFISRKRRLHVGFPPS